MGSLNLDSRVMCLIFMVADAVLFGLSRVRSAQAWQAPFKQGSIQIESSQIRDPAFTAGHKLSTGCVHEIAGTAH